MTDRKAYNAAKQREYRRNNVHAGSVESVHIDLGVHADVHATDTKIPGVDTFAGIGRGIPVNGYVLTHLHGIVSESVWLAGLRTRCAHATHHRANGWACSCCGS